MTLSPDLKHRLVAHTVGMSPLERARTARHFIRKYSIAKEDYKDVAFIACVQEETLI